MTPAERDAIRRQLDRHIAEHIFETHVVDGPHRGHWCHHCDLPSAITATIAVASHTTLRILSRRTFTGCPDCGNQWTNGPITPQGETT